MEGAKSSTVFGDNDPTKLPAVLLSDCWALIAAEKTRARISKAVTVTEPIEAFTPQFLRSLYVRFDEDADGRLSIDELHSLLCIYLNDLQSADGELPRAFTSAVVKSVIQKESKRDFVTWVEFLEGFPIAVRHRKMLWDQFTSATMLDVANIPDE